jgi:hypothetical protein
MNGSAARGTRCVADSGITIEEYKTLESLPAGALALFSTQNVFSSLAWYRTTIAHALPAGAQPAFFVARAGTAFLAVFPMLRPNPGALCALTTPYTCLWDPLLAPSIAGDAAALMRIGLAMGKICRRRATTRLDALDAENAWLAPLLKGLRAAGLQTLRFDHFGNWHTHTAGLTWDQFLAARPGALRESIRRRGKRLNDVLGAKFSITTGGQGLDAAIAFYEKIYAASWKEPEPFPAFNAAFMRACAAEGWLRLTRLGLEEEPVAAQFWAVCDGFAAVLKLAHDERFRPLSPGTVLTSLTISHLLEQEHVDEIDFGRGDDEYKASWTGARRQRVGVVLANPLTASGFLETARHFVGLWRRNTNRLEKLFGRKGLLF